MVTIDVDSPLAGSIDTRPLVPLLDPNGDLNALSVGIVASILVTMATLNWLETRPVTGLLARA